MKKNKRTLIIVGNEPDNDSLLNKKLRTYFMDRRYSYRKSTKQYAFRIKVVDFCSSPSRPYVYTRWGTLGYNTNCTNYDVTFNVSICDSCNRDIIHNFNKTKKRGWKADMEAQIKEACGEIRNRMEKIMLNYFNVETPMIHIKQRFVGDYNSTR